MRQIAQQLTGILTVTNYSFRTDLTRANATEKEISKLLSNQYGMETLEIGNTFEYDLLVRTNKLRNILLEIKEDFKCGSTGNFLLEFEYKGKPSGISTSKAEFYIHKLHMKDGIEYWSTSSEKLKWMIEEKLYFKIVEGGDGSKDAQKVTGIRDATITTKNYLFKLDVFKKYSKQLFIEKVKVEN
jgi:hypothetical protein